MKRFAILAILALAGIAAALYAVFDTGRSTDRPGIGFTAPPPPFAHFVAGAGLTETGRGNVAVGTNLPGIAREVLVRAGESVNAGTPLFRIDDRDANSRLAVADAAVQQAQAGLAAPQHRLGYLQRLNSRGQDLVARDMVTAAQDDVSAATAAVAAARAMQVQARTTVDRLLVRAPVAGKVLQVNVRPGQYVDNASGGTPPVLLGNDERIYLRVNIDESDAWRVRPGARAVAAVRGNPRERIPLQFEYIEPYVTPRASLTGQSTERTDLRTLQVVYSFPRDGQRVYLGQQMDAYIETAPPPSPAAGRNPG